MTAHRLKARVKRAPAHYLLFEHAVEQPEDSVARDVFTFRYLPQLGVTGQQRPAVGFRECQREGVRQRQPRTGSSVLDGEGHPVAVECFYPHAALPHVFTAEGLQFAFVEQVGFGEVEAKIYAGPVPSVPGGSSMRRCRTRTETPSNSAALASETPPSASARKQRRLNRRGRSLGLGNGSS